MKRKYIAGNVVNFNNAVDFCVGTGRLGLGLRRDYFEQLKFVQDAIGFRFIRGHGIFHEDLAILQKRDDGTIEYNFTYLDTLFDGYLDFNIRPFIELGFMPKAISSGEQTVFHWQSNVTPPNDYSDWTALVSATLRHLIERYGDMEVTTWPIEVWNEPNLAVFWKDADMAEYFRLFKETILAVKAVDSRFRVGGPAICGVDDDRWLRGFLDFVRAEALPLDFVTRHLYTIDPPEIVGRYGYPKLRCLAEATGETERSRAIIDSYKEFAGMEMHVTEFNTSYSPRTPIHDTNQNAAYIAYLLSKLGDDCESYSYWTFGDVFEETGVPFTPFHGGFGLLANGCVPKPTFYAFQFFKRLKQPGAECVLRADECVVVRRGGSYSGVAWNAQVGSNEALTLTLELPGEGERCLITETVDDETCNPLKIWHDMGEPPYPSRTQINSLKAGAVPLVRSERVCGGTINLELRPNALVYFELSYAPMQTDWGYQYERACECLNL